MLVPLCRMWSIHREIYLEFTYSWFFKTAQRCHQRVKIWKRNMLPEIEIKV